MCLPIRISLPTDLWLVSILSHVLIFRNIFEQSFSGLVAMVAREGDRHPCYLSSKNPSLRSYLPNYLLTIIIQSHHLAVSSLGEGMG